MCALQCRDDALGAGHQLERGDHLGVGDVRVLGPTDACEIRVLGTDTRVVKASRDAVCFLHLAVLVLHEIAAHTVHHTRLGTADGGATCGLDAHEAAAVVDEPAEDTDRVRAASHTGDHHIGDIAELFDALRPRFLADDPVELAHHPRIRVRAHN